MVWHRLLEGGRLQIRVDRIPEQPYAEENLPEDVRVQVGKRDVRERNDTFLAEELTTTIRRTESGSVIFEFSGSFDAESLKNREFSFTSRKARETGAVTLAAPLLIDKRQ